MRAGGSTPHENTILRLYDSDARDLMELLPGTLERAASTGGSTMESKSWMTKPGGFAILCSNLRGEMDRIFSSKCTISGPWAQDKKDQLTILDEDDVRKILSILPGDYERLPSGEEQKIWNSSEETARFVCRRNSAEPLCMISISR
jgi:hypothetical protein